MAASGGAERNEAKYPRVRCAAVAGKAKGQLVRANWPFAVVCCGMRSAKLQVCSCDKCDSSVLAAFAGASDNHAAK